MPRLIRPTVETEQPAPLTEEQHAQLNRIFGPASQGQVHTLPEDFEEKRQAELEKMGLDNGQPPADSWKPDSRVTEMLGLKGETAAELAEELQNPPTVADTSRTGAGLMADEEEPDIN
ncbi:MAG TPA: hypothetical protein VFQ43_03260, partial [Nitrososphaera sp.]|nr:hypothetical protein [Nitrososphaera sp.]